MKITQQDIEQKVETFINGNIENFDKWYKKLNNDQRREVLSYCLDMQMIKVSGNVFLFKHLLGGK
jgi:hypothetical protein